MKKIVSVATTKAPRAIGPYSQAIVAGGFVFCSGQVALVPATGQLVVGDIAVQTKQVIDNLEVVLVEAGSSLDRVVKTEVYLKDMNHFTEINEVYAQKFSVFPQPARVTVEVARLPKDALVEISAIAYLK